MRQLAAQAIHERGPLENLAVFDVLLGLVCLRYVARAADDGGQAGRLKNAGFGGEGDRPRLVVPRKRERT